MVERYRIKEKKKSKFRWNEKWEDQRRRSINDMFYLNNISQNNCLEKYKKTFTIHYCSLNDRN